MTNCQSKRVHHRFQTSVCNFRAMNPCGHASRAHRTPPAPHSLLWRRRPFPKQRLELPPVGTAALHFRSLEDMSAAHWTISKAQSRVERTGDRGSQLRTPAAAWNNFLDPHCQPNKAQAADVYHMWQSPLFHVFSEFRASFHFAFP
jgi:hypothetical protein